MRNEKFERNTEGLRDALMSEMEDIRAGIATYQEANAFGLLAARVIDTLRADMDCEAQKHRFESDAYQRKRQEREDRLEMAQAAKLLTSEAMEVGDNGPADG